MRDETNLILDSAQRVFARVDDEAIRRAERGEWLGETWDALAEFGAPLMLLGEEQGGFGLPVQDAFALVHFAGQFCVPLPLAEAMLGNWALAQAGLPLGEGPLTVAVPQPGDDVHLERREGGWHIAGTVSGVPWGRFADVVLIADGHMVRIARGLGQIHHDANLADQPRDTLTFDTQLSNGMVAESAELTPAIVEAAGAALCTASIAGALERVLDMAVNYAGEREQFGRPIAKFQAIQQNLARLAGESVAANGALGLAASSFASDVARSGIAAAKSRASEAGGDGAAIAHQIFAAIGFTREHRLNHYTRSLWSWREEFGNEAYWNRELGEAAVEAGPAGLWPMITRLDAAGGGA
ncbi:acyl-CoA dehydrogenase family protein [Erythrobacter sp. W53]|uniref:acyl-CoA dehydrogenase family protein n=1 Tax=Erythrobacter sp. W53 TaxID=3425947 RepID=UPI003D767B59